VLGTLADIEERVAAKGFRRTALILVGRVLDPGP
ncbi:MAG: precorrin-4 C(11)-methyltransferase, partial [Klebsiella sp.]|nr:precorrin-4 C(11)-methyltransferase [Klebsiella sp.]